MARDTHCGIWREKKQGVLPKGLCMFCTLQPSKISLSTEIRSSSHNSPSHERKLPDITFVFLAGLPCSPQSQLPREPCSDSSCDLPCTMWSSTLPLQTRAQHSPPWEVLSAPALGFGVRCQPPAPLKLKKTSFILKPQSCYVHIALQSN